MDEFELLIDLHKHNLRQGPGSLDAAQLALHLVGLKSGDSANKSLPKKGECLQIADIGCGTGAGALWLAEQLNAHITAIDFLQPFLDVMMVRAEERGLSNITPFCTSMDKLNLDLGSLDMIWSEGAIYNMGFEHGIRAWRKFLKPNGLLVVSEITWLTQERPVEVEQYWLEAYPEIALASQKIQQLEEAGYELKGYFPLPVDAWDKEYYAPLKLNLESFLARHDQSAEAQRIVDHELEEQALYARFKDFYSYGVYIAMKRD